MKKQKLTALTSIMEELNLRIFATALIAFSVAKSASVVERAAWSDIILAIGCKAPRKIKK